MWKCLWISEKGQKVKLNISTASTKKQKAEQIFCCHSGFAWNAGDDLFSGEQRWPLGIVNVIEWLRKMWHRITSAKVQWTRQRRTKTTTVQAMPTS